MGDKTGILWTDVTWNPVTGCTRVSPGCEHCYIDRTPPFRIEGRSFHCRRCSGSGYVEDSDGNRFSPSKDGKRIILGQKCSSCGGNGIGPAATTGVRLHPERLDWPLRKRSWRGKRVFVCSLADLFHDDVPDEFIARVFAVMALTPEVTYQVLTKRPARMRALLSSKTFEDDAMRDVRYPTSPGPWPNVPDWPLPNVWLGVTVEDQTRADQRIPLLLETPAAVRWLSCEPLLGPVDLGMDTKCPDTIGHCHHSCTGGRCWRVDTCVPLSGYRWGQDGAGHWTADDKRRVNGIDWVVVGGESGPNARPMHPDWARSLREQCSAAGVPFFFKQWGEWAPDEWIDADGSRHVGHKPEARDSKSLVMHPAGMTALTPDNPFDPWERGHPNWRTVMRCVGKKRSGRLLDGVQHDGYPGGA